MSAYAALVEVEPPAVDDIELSARRVSRPRRVAVAALAAAVVVGLAVFGVALLTRSEGDRSVRTRPSRSTPPMPRRAVVDQDAVLKIVSTRDGRVLRTVTELPTPITSLVTSPDGSTVYASGAESNCEVGPPIFRIRLADGNVALVGSGYSLAMSPDGTH